MSHTDKNQETDRHQAAARKAPEKVNPELLLALLATDWVHGDKHFLAEIEEMARRMLTELGGGPEVKEPTDQQLMAQEAAGRLSGEPTGTWRELPAPRQDEQRMAQSTKAG
jgi:hypothetical protein